MMMDKVFTKEVVKEMWLDRDTEKIKAEKVTMVWMCEETGWTAENGGGNGGSTWKDQFEDQEHVDEQSKT